MWGRPPPGAAVGLAAAPRAAPGAEGSGAGVRERGPCLFPTAVSPAGLLGGAVGEGLPSPAAHTHFEEREFMPSAKRCEGERRGCAEPLPLSALGKTGNALKTMSVSAFAFLVSEL